MKAFFEEYGLVIVVIIVAAVLITVAVTTSKKGGEAMEKTYDNFTNKANTMVNDALDADYKGETKTE